MTKGLNFIYGPPPEDRRPLTPARMKPVTGPENGQSICHRGNDSQAEKTKKTGSRYPGRKNREFIIVPGCKLALSHGFRENSVAVDCIFLLLGANRGFSATQITRPIPPQC